MSLSFAASVSLHQPRPTASKRTETPPPRAKADKEEVNKSVEEERPESENEEDESEQELPEYEGKLICGWHPQAFAAIVAFNAFIIVCAIAAGPGRKHIASSMTVLGAWWQTISSPLTGFLVAWADTLVAGLALLGLSPLIATFALTCVRAATDLRHAPMWQKVSLAALVLAALGTLAVFRERVLWAVAKSKAGWDSISGPLTKFLIDYADYMVAGAALACLLPLGVALLSYAVGAVWGCRVKLVVEPVTGDPASPAKKLE